MFCFFEWYDCIAGMGITGIICNGFGFMFLGMEVL